MNEGYEEEGDEHSKEDVKKEEENMRCPQKIQEDRDQNIVEEGESSKVVIYGQCSTDEVR